MKNKRHNYQRRNKGSVCILSEYFNLAFTLVDVLILYNIIYLLLFFQGIFFLPKINDVITWQSLPCNMRDRVITFDYNFLLNIFIYIYFKNPM